MYLAKSKALYEQKQKAKQNEEKRIKEMIRPIQIWLKSYNLLTIKKHLFDSAKKGLDICNFNFFFKNTNRNDLNKIKILFDEYKDEFNTQDKNIQISWDSKEQNDYYNGRVCLTGSNFSLKAKFEYPIEDFLYEYLDYRIYPMIPIITKYYNEV